MLIFHEKCPEDISRENPEESILDIVIRENLEVFLEKYLDVFLDPKVVSIESLEGIPERISKVIHWRKPCNYS